MILGILAPDRLKPVVAFSSPANGANVTGTITVAVTATDNAGIAGVQFVLDGSNWGAEITAAPFQKVVDTHTLAAGAHTVQAIARDKVGNTQTATITFNVTNAPPAGGSLNFGSFFSGDRMYLPRPDIGEAPDVFDPVYNLAVGGAGPYYKRQVRLFVGTAEQNNDAAAHVVQLFIAGSFLTQISAYYANQFNNYSAWNDYDGSGAILFKRYESAGWAQDETAKTLDVRVEYQYVLVGGYLS